MLGPALLDDDRGDAFGRGATGYGVRMLIELAARMSASGELSGSGPSTIGHDQERQPRSGDQGGCG